MAGKHRYQRKGWANLVDFLTGVKKKAAPPKMAEELRDASRSWLQLPPYVVTGKTARYYCGCAERLMGEVFAGGGTNQETRTLEDKAGAKAFARDYVTDIQARLGRSTKHYRTSWDRFEEFLGLKEGAPAAASSTPAMTNASQQDAAGSDSSYIDSDDKEDNSSTSSSNGYSSDWASLGVSDDEGDV